MHLLESSKIKKKRSLGGTIFSVVFHSAILFLVVYTTAQARTPEPKESPAKKVIFTAPVPKSEPKSAEPEAPKTKAPAAKSPKVAAPPVTPRVSLPKLPASIPTVTAPINIPTNIPDIGAIAKVVGAGDFEGNGVSSSVGKNSKSGGGNSSNGIGISGGLGSGGTYSELEVDEAVVSLGGAEPIYPEAMRTAGVEGQVVAQFIVDERGRVQTRSFKVLSATNDMFAAAVRAALPRMRFKPAKLNGQPVKQLVQQPFQFKLNT